MMSVEIYLPMNDNQGTPFPEPVFTRIETALTEKLGGVTAYKRVHAQGRWKSEVPTPTKSQFSKSSSARSIWSGGAIVASPLNGKAIVQDAADAVQLGRIGLHGNDGAAVSDRLREMGVPRRLGSGRRRRANGPAGDGCRPRSNNGRGEPADGDDRAEPGDGHHAQAGEQPSDATCHAADRGALDGMVVTGLLPANQTDAVCGNPRRLEAEGDVAGVLESSIGSGRIF
jgi:hypothetical protein